MMDNQIDRELLEKIADMLGKPVGSFNIRKDSGCDGRQSTENIQITDKEDKPGIDLWSFARLTETFEQIHCTGSATMIIISHQERIISLADEVIVVGDGQLRHRGAAADILPQILADTLGGCPVLTKEAKSL